MLKAMHNSDEQMKHIIQAQLLSPDEKSSIYCNELHRFQLIQKQQPQKALSRL